MCPRSFFEWKSMDMDFEDFKKLPFSKFSYAHLQGWGEPLLNSEIGEMIEFAKKKCRVGLTTNGLLIDEWKESLLKLDLLAVSIAGINAQREVRKSRIEEIAPKIQELALRKKRPKIVIATLMMRNTIAELPALVEMAKKIGVDQVIANNLDYIPSKNLVGLEVFSNEVDREIFEIVERAKRRAEEIGIEFVVRPLKFEEAAVCAENPIRNCFVTVEGLIAPCAYLHLPTNGEWIVRYFKGEERRVRKVYFGRAEDFKSVWKCKDYVNFRKMFEERIYFSRELPEGCRTCYKAYSL